MLAVWRAMLNSPMLSIFQHFHAIPLRSPLISLRSKWRLTGFSRRFTPKNPVRLHKPFGQLPRWGAKNVLPLNLIALPISAWISPPKKGEIASPPKIKRDFLKKVRYCIIFQKKKQGRTIIQNARWWGGDNLSVKGLYFKNALRLAFFRAEL